MYYTFYLEIYEIWTHNSQFWVHAVCVQLPNQIYVIPHRLISWETFCFISLCQTVLTKSENLTTSPGL